MNSVMAPPPAASRKRGIFSISSLPSLAKNATGAFGDGRSASLSSGQ
jgi:hypothetical protein